MNLRDPTPEETARHVIEQDENYIVCPFCGAGPCFDGPGLLMHLFGFYSCPIAKHAETDDSWKDFVTSQRKLLETVDGPQQ